MREREKEGDRERDRERARETGPLASRHEQQQAARVARFLERTSRSE